MHTHTRARAHARYPSIDAHTHAGTRGKLEQRAESRPDLPDQLIKLVLVLAAVEVRGCWHARVDVAREERDVFRAVHLVSAVHHRCVSYVVLRQSARAPDRHTRTHRHERTGTHKHMH